MNLMNKPSVPDTICPYNLELYLPATHYWSNKDD